MEKNGISNSEKKTVFQFFAAVDFFEKQKTTKT